MAINDEVVKLVLDLVKSAGSDATIAALEALKTSAQQTKDVYEVLEGELGTYTIAQSKATQSAQQYTPALDASVAKAVEATRTQKLLRESLEEVSAAQAKAGGTSRDFQMRILNLGRATQDLAQGGLAGILNNIEGIVGGGGLAAGVLTGIGTAAFIATPYIKEWWKSLQAPGEKIPEVTSATDRFTGAIKKNKDAIEELRKQETLTYDDLVKYKELVQQTAELEEQAANAKTARAVGAFSDKKSRDTASAVKEAISEKFESSQQLIDNIMATERGQQLGLKRIEEIIAGAIKGNRLELANLRNISPEFSREYEQFSPERKELIEKEKERDKKELEFTKQRMAEIERKEKAAQKAADEFIRDQQDIAKDTERDGKERERLKKQRDAEAQRNFRANGPGAAQLRSGDEAAWQRDIVRRLNALGGNQGNADQDRLLIQMQANQGLISQNELMAGMKLIQAQETFKKLQQANNVLNGVN